MAEGVGGGGECGGCDAMGEAVPVVCTSSKGELQKHAPAFTRRIGPGGLVLPRKTADRRCWVAAASYRPASAHL